MPPANTDTRPSETSQQPQSTYYAWGVCGFLLLAIALVYGQTLGHGFLNFDDNGYVFANPYVTPGLTSDGIWWALTDGPYGEWYPPTMLSHMLDCQLFGLQAWGHHLTSVLLHAAASITLFLVLRRMTGEFWPSAFVATVFAVHPQRVESVAWVAERRDVLSGLFFMLTLGAYLGFLRQGRTPIRYGVMAVLFALGLMSKPMLVTLPALLLLLDYWPLRRFGAASDIPGPPLLDRPGFESLLLEKLPLVALAVGDCVLTLRTHNPGGTSFSWPARIGNAAVSCVTYIVQFFCPVDLAAYYPVPPGGPPMWKAAGAIAIVVAISAAAVIARRRCPYLFIGWFWYLGMLFPVLGLIQVSGHAMADRYMYLPGVGLAIALAWGAERIFADSKNSQRVLAACAGLAIAILVAVAARQTSFWRDDETLWRHALAVTTDNGEAEFNLSYALVGQGRIDDAIIHLRRAEEHASDVSPFINLGVILAQQGKLDEAIAEYRQALARDSTSALAVRAHINLASVLTARGQIVEAADHYRQALQIEPGNPTARQNLDNLFRAGPNPSVPPAR